MGKLLKGSWPARLLLAAVTLAIHPAAIAFDGEIDRRVTDALGLTARENPPLSPASAVGMSDPSNGVAYFVLSLPDERYLFGRREWTGQSFYWLLVSHTCALERGVFAVQSGVTPLDQQQAQTEYLQILAFLRSRTSQADAIAHAPNLQVCVRPE